MIRPPGIISIATEYEQYSTNIIHSNIVHGNGGNKRTEGQERRDTIHNNSFRLSQEAGKYLAATSEGSLRSATQKGTPGAPRTHRSGHATAYTQNSNIRGLLAALVLLLTHATAAAHLEHCGVEEVNQALLSGSDGNVSDEDLDLALHLGGLDGTQPSKATHGTCGRRQKEMINLVPAATDGLIASTRGETHSPFTIYPKGSTTTTARTKKV